MHPIEGFIFDLDGTLVTSNLDFMAIKDEIGCPLERDALDYIKQLEHESDRQHAYDIIHQHELHDAKQSHWMPGAQKFVETCVAKNFPVAIVTRNSHQSSMLKIQKNEIPIQLLKTRENALPKPNPQALNDLAKIFGLPTEKIMMIGDYHYDIAAGNNANMISCLVNFTQRPNYAEHANFAFESFSELYHHIFE